MIQYKLYRSDRKSIAIKIRKDATVEVRAPARVPQEEIDRIVAEKETWIIERLRHREQINSEKAAFELSYGDNIQLCGAKYPICAKEGNVIGYNEECFYMPPAMPPDRIKQAVIEIYKLAAKNIFTRKVMEYASVMDVRPAAVKINSAKTRWGSCSSKGSINFSWKLAIGDDEVSDYVVVHELAHMKEPNHSKNFWAVVESVMPDYAERKEKLRELQEKIAREDWE